MNSEQYGSYLFEMSDINSAGMLASDFLDDETLERIASLSKFDGTIYRSDPSLLTSYSELHLVRQHFEKEGVVFYYTLLFPVLTDTSLVGTYKVEQTGFFVDGKHMMLSMPRQLALIDGRYVEFECKNYIFDLCRIDKKAIIPSCLQVNESLPHELCSTIPADCGDTQCTINSMNGVLVTTKHAIHAFVTMNDGGKRMETIQPSPTHAFFLPWRNYSSVVVMGNRREIKPPMDLDHKFHIISNSDYINWTSPVLEEVPKLELSEVALLRSELAQFKNDLHNISQHITKEKKDESANDDSTWASIWSRIRLYLHFGQLIFVIYLAVQFILLIRKATACKYRD